MAFAHWVAEKLSEVLRLGSHPLGHWWKLPTAEVPLKPTGVSTMGVPLATGAAVQSTVEPPAVSRQLFH